MRDSSSLRLFATADPHRQTTPNIATRWIGHRHLACLITALLLAPPAVSPQDAIPPAADACVRDQPETTPSDGFELQGEGASVIHTATSLEWQRCVLGQTWNPEQRACEGRPGNYRWDEAQKAAAAVGDNWRLPRGEELLSIVERCHFAPAVNPQVFPNTPSGIYWTLSSDTSGLDRAWAVSFFTGSAYRAAKAQLGKVRLVKGEMQQPAAQTP